MATLRSKTTKYRRKQAARDEIPAAAFNAEEQFAAWVRSECNDIAEMLIAKNAVYGNSALNPLRCLSRADAAEGIRIRIDDKLSRLRHGSDAGEDTIKYLIGYLVLLRLASR